MKPEIKNSLLLWSVIILIIINVSSLGTMWYHKSSRSKRARVTHSQRQAPRQQRGNSMSEKLALSDGQKNAFDSLYKLHRSNSSKLMAEMRKNREAMQTLVMSESVELDSIKSLNYKNSQIYEALSWGQLEMHRNRMQILNAEQQKKYKELQNNFGERQRGRSGAPSKGRSGF